MRRLLGGVFAIVLVALAAISIATRVVYGTWIPTTNPDHVDLCGHVYQRESTITLSQLAAENPSVAVPAGLTALTRVPAIIGRPVLAAPTPSAACPTVLYVSAGSDTYRRYTRPIGG